MLLPLASIFAVLLCHAFAYDGNFVRDSNCTWTNISDCNGVKRKLSSLKIDLLAPSGFPSELEQSARVAINVWRRAIRGRPSRTVARTAELPVDCIPGPIAGDNLLIWLQMEDIKDPGTIARTIVEQELCSNSLPRFVSIVVNSQNAGMFHRCDWNNIFLHEIGHALGFYDIVFQNLGFYHERQQYNNVSGQEKHQIAVFAGENTKREFEAMGGSNESNMYPLLTSDGSHWLNDYLSSSPAPGSYCFSEPELMDPTYSSWVIRGNTDNPRKAISRMTLAVFRDIGYKVDMNCADDGASPLFPNCEGCQLGGEGPPLGEQKKKGRKERRNASSSQHGSVPHPRSQGGWTRQQYDQVRKYCRGIKITAYKKKLRQIGERLRKLSGKMVRRCFPSIRKRCRKARRRILRKVRGIVKASVGWAHDPFANT